jgi:hypothetical protein
MKEYLDRAPSQVRADLDNPMYRKVNGDYSVGKSSYRSIKRIGRYIVNQVPMKLRDDFISQFVMKNPNDFRNLYKKSKHSAYRWK